MRVIAAGTLGLALTAAACGGSSSPGPAAPTAPTKPKRPPNIVFIVTDDLDARSFAFMPRVKSVIGDRGLTFTSTYVSVPVCCPSRASILTGKYAHNHGVLFNGPPNGGFETFHDSGEERSTLATWLKAQGYRTAMIGKYLNGYPSGGDPSYVPPGWDEWFGIDSEVTSDTYFNYGVNVNGQRISFGDAPDDYETDVLERRATEFLRLATRDREKPFLLYLAPSAPHTSAIPAPRHASAHPGVFAPRVPSFNEGDVSDKPGWVREMDPLSDREIEKMDRLYRNRLQTLLAVDEMVEHVVGTLDQAGVLGETYVFFTSDNGFQLGEHRFPHGKDSPYEESILVPLVVRGPGVPAGRVLPHIVSNVDFAPTFAQMAGATVPGEVDGQSLMPLLGSSPPAPESWRRDVLIEHFARFRRGIPAFQELRTPTLAYVEYDDGNRELYDMRSDPYQLDNGDGQAPAATVDALSRRLDALRKCRGASCR
jgi:N-acetylglucosamine-6-sulfatase